VVVPRAPPSFSFVRTREEEKKPSLSFIPYQTFSQNKKRERERQRERAFSLEGTTFVKGTRAVLGKKKRKRRLTQRSIVEQKHTYTDRDG
jgi:hypothetical protein